MDTVTVTLELIGLYKYDKKKKERTEMVGCSNDPVTDRIVSSKMKFSLKKGINS